MNKKIKVLYILHSTIMGGATISFFNMILPLMDKGVIPYIIIPRNESIDEKFNKIVVEKHIKVYRCTLYQSTLIRFVGVKCIIQLLKFWIILFGKFSAIIELSLLVRKIKPDIIHTNTGVIHEGFSVAQFYGIPHIWHLREYQTLDFNMQILFSFSSFCSKLRKSYVISITNDILHYFGLLGHSRATTIYNGIFTKKELQPVETKKKYFLCASRLSPEKGLDDIIKVFSAFSKEHEDYRLCIAGFGEKKYVDKLKLLAEQYNCLDKIEFVGFVQDVKSLMQGAKALLVASYCEGFGRMTAEAAFCGCAVIGRNTGGTKEILNYIGGIQFTDNDVFLQKMNIIARMGRDEYERMVVRAQQKAMEKYSIENNVEKVYAFYEKILSQS